MSQALTLARPYARAAYGVARDEGRVDAWSAALALSAQVAADPRVDGLLRNPALRDDEAVVLLAPQGVDASYGRFLALLAQAGRLPLLGEVAGLFEQLRAEDQRVVRARVTSATELAPQELERLRDALKRRFGRDVEVVASVDAGLLGGALIDAGDVVIDGSLKGKLARLQAALAG
ncbi:F0F1 ATP synthase subunit delta [Pseudoxanthomonas koreensis]|uniref:F0F1 ATP synthase subunit delta n=1 Tax=Pseudoxanthomonas koreensis TaxID=266061 RepID=UPI0035A6DD0E